MRNGKSPQTAYRSYLRILRNVRNRSMAAQAGVCYLYQIRWALVIIGTAVLLTVIGARVYRYRKGQRWRDDDEIP